MEKDLSIVYKRIQKYAKTADTKRYDMRYKEIQAIYECSGDIWGIITLAFDFGFAKGCRKTKKEANLV